MSQNPVLVIHPAWANGKAQRDAEAAGYFVVIADPAQVAVLGERPHGFTREDAERLRAIVLDEAAGPWVANKFGFRTDDAYKWADDLAARIEALLPPETL